MKRLVPTWLVAPDADPPAGVLGWTLLRVGVGLALLLGHGLGKLPPPDGFVDMVRGLGLPAPEVGAWLSALSETVGAGLLVLGLLTRLAALTIAVNMSVAIFLAHGGAAFDVREKAVLYGLVALAFVLRGGGRWSVDASLARASTVVRAPAR